MEAGLSTCKAMTCRRYVTWSQLVTRFLFLSHEIPELALKSGQEQIRCQKPVIQSSSAWASRWLSQLKFWISPIFLRCFLTMFWNPFHIIFFLISSSLCSSCFVSLSSLDVHFLHSSRSSISPHPANVSFCTVGFYCNILFSVPRFLHLTIRHCGLDFRNLLILLSYSSFRLQHWL